MRQKAFFSLMAGFLLLPIMPIQFTSIITAIVWSLAGPLAGMAFLLAGTFFRPDSLPILSGIQSIIGRLVPGSDATVDEALSVVTMLVGNLMSALLFKWILSSRIVRRLPLGSRLGARLA